MNKRDQIFKNILNNRHEHFGTLQTVGPEAFEVYALGLPMCPDHYGNSESQHNLPPCSGYEYSPISYACYVDVFPPNGYPTNMYCLT